MFGVTTSDDYRPVAWMGRYPVDVTTMLVGIHVAAAILAAILVAFGAGSVLLWLQFDSAAIWSSGQVWRLFTYAFVHAPSGLLWFAIEMYLLFVFGREVERFLGRRAYIALYAFLLVTPAALLTIWGLWERCAIAGSPALHFGIFVAFATIYPRVEMLLRIHGEVGRANSGCHLHSSTTRLSRLERSGRCMDEHRRRISFRRTEWCRPGARLVECGESTVRFTSPSITSFRNHERAPAAAAQNRKTFTRPSIRSSTKFPSLELEASPRASGGSWIASANGC